HDGSAEHWLGVRRSGLLASHYRRLLRLTPGVSAALTERRCATGGRQMATSDVSARDASGDRGGLFIRQTSGLVRELGIPAAVGISLASVAVVNTFINFNAGLTAFPKADMFL